MSAIALTAFEQFWRPRHRVNVGAALTLAVLSTACYATSAVMQEQEAGGQDAEGLRLVRQLIHRPRWWFAVFASASGAALHIVALALGPLSVVQPIGVLTLVLALPLGARWGGRRVTGTQWRAAVAVAVGLAAVLAAVPHRPRPANAALLSLPAGLVVIIVLVVLAVAVARRLPAGGAPILYAGAAATCFGLASAMTRVAATGAAPLPLAASIAVLGAAGGLATSQSAYRTGGLGAPLAVLILVDPLVAVGIGVAVLGEPVPVTPLRVVLGVAGLAATAVGIWVLARAQDPGDATRRVL